MSKVQPERLRTQWAGTLIVYVTAEIRHSELVNWEIEYAAKQAMRITEILTFKQYNADPRVELKNIRNGSRKQSSGNNIYFPAVGG
ncbi:TIR domain-containing protein [Thalassospira xiamenensis]|uniref:TIR domain-containing protein n=1 Tax=Thalassospira xiamenensis TaxID=220697 RepID=UPI000DEDD7A9